MFSMWVFSFLLILHSDAYYGFFENIDVFGLVDDMFVSV
jgi:hypothetical protein